MGQREYFVAIVCNCTCRHTVHRIETKSRVPAVLLDHLRSTPTMYDRIGSVVRVQATQMNRFRMPRTHASRGIYQNVTAIPTNRTALWYTRALQFKVRAPLHCVQSNRAGVLRATRSMRYITLKMTEEYLHEVKTGVGHRTLEAVKQSQQQ